MLEATCSCDSVWFRDVVQLDGANISAIAYHSYPSIGKHRVTLAQFLGPLTAGGNISSTYRTVRSDIVGRCSNCSTLPIFLQEYNAGPGWAPSILNGTYANALFLAASTVQALRANVTMFTVFSLESNYSIYDYSLLNKTDTVGPTGVLYGSLLSHLATGSVYNLTLRTGASSVWPVLSENSTTASVLIVNANLTRSLKVYLGPMVRHGSRGTVYEWDPSRAVPASSSGRLPGTLTIPSEGILLIDVSLGAIPSPSPPHSALTAHPDYDAAPAVAAVSRSGRG